MSEHLSERDYGQHITAKRIEDTLSEYADEQCIDFIEWVFNKGYMFPITIKKKSKIIELTPQQIFNYYKTAKFLTDAKQG